MARTPRPQPSWGVADTPNRRIGKAGARDVVVLILPFLVLAAAGGVLVGRIVALPLLAVGLLLRPAVHVATGTTPGLRRQRIRIVRTGNRPPAWWQLLAWNVAPFLVAVPALFSGGSGDLRLFLLAWVPYLVALALGWWRGRGRGPNSDPFLALVGLEVAWAGEPPTPSGTSGPPAPAPPPPTPPAPARPSPGPRPETPGQR